MDSQFVRIYDSTLRDGSQGPGVNFSMADKLRLARSLDAFGVDYLEGGWPSSNPKDAEFFAHLRRHPLQYARLVAFGSTCHPGLKAADDANLQALKAAGTPAVTLVGKTWLLHVREILKISPKKNLKLIADSLDYLSSPERELIFDAENFFDAYASDQDYALSVLDTAWRHGATTLVLCDTNGGTLPGEIFQVCGEVRKILPAEVNLGIHCHNDSDCAVASSLLAVQAGCRQVQGCFNGFGERCGNANLCSIIPAIMLKLHLNCLRDSSQLTHLTDLSRLVYELSVVRESPQQPYVGKMAFAHKGGMHINGVTKNPATFEHVAPESVGNKRQFLLSELSGLTSIQEKAQEQSLKLPEDEARKILNELKQQEAAGYSYEAADASFKMLVQKHLGQHKPHFSLEGFRVIIEKRSFADACLSEATIKVKVNGQTELTAAEGEGPVNALDVALRKALQKFFPGVSRMQLRDFKVRILDGAQGTAALTRVLVDSSDGKQSWGTVGMSENIIEASWQALLDSVEYFLQREEAGEQ